MSDIRLDLVQKWMEQDLAMIFGDNPIQTVRMPYVSPAQVIAHVESLGAEKSDDWGSNGWVWDYWIPFTYKGKRYIISGSGYYGNLTVGPADKD